MVPSCPQSFKGSVTKFAAPPSSLEIFENKEGLQGCLALYLPFISHVFLLLHSPSQTHYCYLHGYAVKLSFLTSKRVKLSDSFHFSLN